MASTDTRKKLTEVEDSTPGFGFGKVQEARFAQGELEAEHTGVSFIRVKPGKRQAGPDGLEYLAFGPRYESGGEIFPGWWED